MSAVTYPIILFSQSGIPLIIWQTFSFFVWALVIYGFFRIGYLLIKYLKSKNKSYENK